MSFSAIVNKGGNRQEQGHQADEVSDNPTIIRFEFSVFLVILSFICIVDMGVNAKSRVQCSLECPRALTFCSSNNGHGKFAATNSNKTKMNSTK